MEINNNILVKVSDSDIKNGTVEIPEIIVGISDWAFQYCKKLKTIKIPNNVKFLGHGIFDNCVNLIDVSISKGLEELPYSTFNSCDSLERIDVDRDNKKLYSRNGVVYSKDLKEVICCPAKRYNVIIPRTVTTIKRNAFMGCSRLQQIRLPESLETIEGCAFSRCTNLNELYLPYSLKNLDYFAFFCSNVKQVVLDDEEPEFEYNVLLNCSSLKSIVIKDRGIPVPNTSEVFNFLQTKSYNDRKQIIESSNNAAVKAGLSLYVYENEKSDEFVNNFYSNIFWYGKFIIDNSSDKELKTMLSSRIFRLDEYNENTLSELKKLKAYYKEQKTIELDLEK